MYINFTELTFQVLPVKVLTSTILIKKFWFCSMSFYSRIFYSIYLQLILDLPSELLHQDIQQEQLLISSLNHTEN